MSRLSFFPILVLFISLLVRCSRANEAVLSARQYYNNQNLTKQIHISYFPVLSVLAILLITFLTGCVQTRPASPVPTFTVAQTLINTLQPADAYPPHKDEVPSVFEYPYPPSNPEPTPTGTPVPKPTSTLFALSKPLPAPLYFINQAEGSKRQVWRLERDGAMTTQITHEEFGVTDLDVAEDGRLAYLSNNTLIVTDAWGGQRKVLAQGDPLPVWNDYWSEWAQNFTLLFEDAKGIGRLVSAKDEPRVWNDVLGQKVVDDNFIWLTIPIWSQDSSQIAFGWDAAWLVNPDSGELTRVTEQRTDETRGGQFTYIPIGWTPDGEKIILNILPPRFGHGGDGPPWGLGFVDPRQNSNPINRGTLGCCQYSLLENGKVLFGDGYGLSEMDPMTGKRQILLPEQDPQKPPNYPGMGWPKQSLDGHVYFFTGFGTEAKHTTVLAYVDGKKSPIQYFKPDDATWVSQVELEWFEEALWSADAKMVILSGYDSAGRKAIYQMSTVDGSVTLLGITGYNLAWGK